MRTWTIAASCRHGGGGDRRGRRQLPVYGPSRAVARGP